MKNFFPRLISGIIYAAIIVAGTTWHPYSLIGLMALFCALCLIEFCKITQLKDRLYQGMILVGFGIVFFLFARDFLSVSDALYENGTFPFFLNTMAFAGPVLFLFSILLIFFSPQELNNDFSKATIGITYLVVPFALSLTLPSFGLSLGKTTMHYEVLFVFILLWISDSMAYIVGSLFGKHPMAPKISQAKSWEGFAGGFISTILVGYAISQWSPVPLQGNWLIIGIIVAITAPLGDLTESKLKRTFQVKDSGHLIPGHGGFLDRLDSYIFVVPMIYTYLLLTNTL